MPASPANPIGPASFTVWVSVASVSGSAGFLEAAPGFLLPEEVDRSRRFLREADRLRFVLGRAMVRKICARYLGTEPVLVRLDQTPLGKLWLVHPPSWSGGLLEFNVSHSGDVVAVAWSLAGPVGVDVECLDRSFSTAHSDIARLVFSSDERTALSSLEGTIDGLAAFFRIWVRKEAVIKAEGCGIGGRLQEFTVVSRKSSETTWAGSVTYPDGKIWRLVELACPDGHVGALALPPEGTVGYVALAELGMK